MTEKMSWFGCLVAARFPAMDHVNLALHANDSLSCGLQAPQVLMRKPSEQLWQRHKSEAFKPIMGPCVYAVGAFCCISSTLMPSTVLKLPSSPTQSPPLRPHPGLHHVRAAPGDRSEVTGCLHAKPIMGSQDDGCHGSHSMLSIL